MSDIFLTKECDYGVRTIRALADGEKKTVETICELEKIPGQYAYKILKKLERAGFVQSVRGRDGGYQLVKPLHQLTLYDIVSAIDESLFLFACLQKHHVCVHNNSKRPCTVHQEFMRIQDVLIAEMQRKNMQELLNEHD